jgi:hypothetical protein
MEQLTNANNGPVVIITFRANRFRANLVGKKCDDSEKTQEDEEEDLKIAVLLTRPGEWFARAFIALVNHGRQQFVYSDLV